MAAGQSQLDKAHVAANQPANDTAKINALNYLAKYHANSNPDSSLLYANHALALSEKLHYLSGSAGAKLTKGIIETDKGNYPEALEWLLAAGADAQEAGDHRLYAASRLLLGNYYNIMNDSDKALDMFREGILVSQEHNFYPVQASLFTAVGSIMRTKGELDSALYYYDRVLDVARNYLRDSTLIASVYNNIGNVYFQKKQHRRAEAYILKSLEINRRTGNKRLELMNLGNLGTIMGDKENGDLARSIKYYNEAIALGEELGAKDVLESFYKSVSQIYALHGNYKDAYEFMIMRLAYKDSVLDESKQNQILAISQQFKTRQIQDSLRYNQQELKLARLDEDAASLDATRKKWQLAGAIIILVAILVLLLMVYRTAQRRRRTNQLLQEKNYKISDQKLIIEEKNTEITNSINYARRIQSALLPSAGYMKKVLGDHFLLFKPKDIVSGDFYWVKSADDKHCFAVADCTGHGVPGAMLSMLAYETIEQVAAENPRDAAHFVNRINDVLTGWLSSKADDADQHVKVRDGMDLSVCMVSDRKILSYCGANNECYIIRKNVQPFPSENDVIAIHHGDQYSIIELKATRRPIGLSDTSQEFKSAQLQLLKNDMCYLFSDGYADQFGGDKGKKMKTSTFRQVLLQLADQPMTEQLMGLKDHLERWQNQFDQLDDITVLGVKIE